jgi:predicted DCC family thiol-disulfide oxidoreductase YuxK
MNKLSKNNILFFDEDCILCNKSIHIIHFLDIQKRIYFSSLQSELGIIIQKKIKLNQTLSTVIYYKNGKLHTKSTAIIRCVSDLYWPLKLTLIFLLIPKPIRNFTYDFIAKNRKRIFSNQTCKVPSESLKKQLL